MLWKPYLIQELYEYILFVNRGEMRESEQLNNGSRPGRYHRSLEMQRGLIITSGDDIIYRERDWCIPAKITSKGKLDHRQMNNPIDGLFRGLALKLGETSC